MIKSKKITNHEIIKHETKKRVFANFLIVLIIFLLYFVFIATKFGVEKGFFVTGLTWSFFVLCTPIADAGFLFDFPIRFITHIKMLFSEIFVWLIAISLNIYAFFFHPEIYSETKLLLLFKHILDQPFPYFAIIIVSGIGTFMSVLFGDELMDKKKHRQRNLYKKHKYNFRFVSMIFVVFSSIILYDFLLKQLGVDLPL